MRNNDLRYNGEGYLDKTAEKAIKNADRTPYEVTEMVDILKKIAGVYGYEIVGRIAFKSKKTGIIYK